MNTLLVTSCNRIKQTTLALVINSHLIEEKFNLVVTDCSTPDLNLEDGVDLHSKTDAYNHIDKKSYCSDVILLKKCISLIPNVKDYRILHLFPRERKEIGDGILISTGLVLTNLIYHDDFCFKLSGVAIMKENLFSMFSNSSKKHDLIVFSFLNESFSTRVFAYNSKNILGLLKNNLLCNMQIGDTETRFTTMIKENFLEKTLDTKLNENNVCLNFTGEKSNITRKKITSFIEEINIDMDNPIIREFLDGGIYE